MGIELSADQSMAVEEIEKWYRGVPATQIAEFCTDGTAETQNNGGCPARPHTHGYAHDYPVMSLGGLAGTGKTTVMGTVAERLGARVAYCAPTHKAAAVLRRKLLPELKVVNGVETEKKRRVQTYHSVIYYPHVYYTCRISKMDVKEDLPKGGAEAGAFVPCGIHNGLECQVDDRLVFDKRPFLGGHHHLVIVDEASMISEAQIADIRSFGVPLLLVGDHGQLAPVKADMNPWIKDPVTRLEINHRQGEGASITKLAHDVRNGKRVSSSDATPEIGVLQRVSEWPYVEALFERFNCGPQRVVITWRNTTRVGINKVMRSKEDDPNVPPRTGDRVVSLGSVELPQMEEHRVDGATRWKRAYGVDPVLVHNGEMGEIVQVGRTGDSGRVIELAVKLDDAHGEPRPVIQTWAAVHQFNEPTALPRNDHKRRPYTNRTPDGHWESWDYGYAITAHKAQGSEFDDVIVIDEGPMEYDRWMYTAITRAAKRLVVVKW